MHQANLHELLYQALETEKGGVQVYETALRCAVHQELKREWTEYLEQTRRHVEIVQGLLRHLGLDSDRETPGSLIVRGKAQALVDAMEQAQKGGDREQAQLVAAECVVDAETKDHMNWELIGEASTKINDESAEALEKAFEKVERQEDEHLYHTMGWARELWIEYLGMPAVLPPPEEKQDVDSMAQAAKARQQRSRLLRRSTARAGARPTRGKRTRGKRKATKVAGRR